MRTLPAAPARLPVPVRQAVPARVATPVRRTGQARAAGASDGVDQNQMHDAELQLALAAQAARFDAMMKVLAEQQREINAIIDLGMAQTKRDDALMNQWIRLI